MTPQGRRLLKGLKQVSAHLDGKTALPAYRYTITSPVDVRAIRTKIGLSQAEFAARFAISPRTLQDWEQGRRVPDATVRAYLTVIDLNAEAVESALLRRGA